MKQICVENYRPEWRHYFAALNKAWIEKFFVMEPVDEYVLYHPEEAILQDGGVILFAAYDHQIIGTVALKKIDDTTMELTKMAVDEAFQGLGAGKLLCETAITKARQIGVKKIILYTQSSLQTALVIYRRLGFKDVPIEVGKYERADTKMELMLSGSAVPNS